MNEHLTKEEELRLGRIIQQSLKAKELIAAHDENSELELDMSALQADIRAGEAAVARLSECNTGLVWARARAFKAKFPSALPLEDLVQEGFIGLLKAAYKYDPAMNNKFSTVAYLWIHQAMGRATNKTGRLVRLPENRVQNFIDIGNARARYEDSMLTSDEIDQLVMDDLKLSKTEFMEIMAAGSSVISLNKTVSSEAGSGELQDFVLEDKQHASSEEFVMKSAIMEILNEKLSELSQVEQDVIGSAFLVEGLAAKRATTAEVREKHSLTPQKFKRVLTEGLKKLKSSLEELDVTFEDFLD